MASGFVTADGKKGSYDCPREYGKTGKLGKRPTKMAAPNDSEANDTPAHERGESAAEKYAEGD